MAQGGIRKGFFFYFGLLVLLVIAVFLIILVVLFFNPGKTIIGLQYFTGGETVQLQTTTDESKTPINFWSSNGNVNNIVVDCSYADVYVQVSEDIHENCVQITNEASGFATAGQARPYEYSVLLDGSTLRISVQEPVGFLYFSNNISITINITSNYSDGESIPEGDFDGVTFDIQTTSGNVYLGTSNSRAYEIKPGNLTVETTSGDIFLSRNLSFDNVSVLTLETGSGEITTDSYNVALNGESNLNGRGIIMDSGTVNLTTDTGLMDFDLIRIDRVINDDDGLYLTNENGNMTIGEMDVDIIKLNSVEGNYYFDTVTTTELSYTPSEDRLLSPNIRIGTLNGNLVMSSSHSSTPNVTVEHLNGRLSLTDIDGSYNIGEMSGVIEVVSERANLTIGISDSTSRLTDNIETTSGDITLNFLGSTARNMTITTDSGKVTMNVVDETGFTSTVYDNETREVLANDTDRITVNIGTHEADRNPLDIDPSSGTAKGTFTIYTNDEVEYVKE